MKPRRAILVTGAMGLIGAEVVARLSQRHPVIAVMHKQPTGDTHGRLCRAFGRVRAVVRTRGRSSSRQCVRTRVRSGHRRACRSWGIDWVHRARRRHDRFRRAGTGVPPAERCGNTARHRPGAAVAGAVHLCQHRVCLRPAQRNDPRERAGFRTGIQQRVRAEQVPRRTAGESGTGAFDHSAARDRHRGSGHRAPSATTRISTPWSS